MQTALRFAILSLTLTLAGCATQGSLDNIRNDIDAVKTRLFSVEKDLAGVRSESREQMGTVEKDLKSEISGIRKIAADTQATVDSNKAEMQALNGRLDDLGTTVKKPSEDLSRYRDDADKRIIIMEDRILKLQAMVDDLNKKTADTNLQKDVPASPDAIYMKGLEIYKTGNMPDARERFQKFVEQNPSHDLAANAQYWIGETYYSEKSYEPAILAFQEVIKNFPGKEKVPAAMLKQAMAFQAIKDVKSAKYVLKKLIESSPKSEEAKKAKELLKEIK